MWALAPAGCYRGVDPGQDAETTGSVDTSDEGGTGDQGADARVGELPLRRLDRREYDNTIRDLLGDESQPARAFAPDLLGASGFAEAAIVTSAPARELMIAAEAVALRAIEDLGPLVPCEVTAIDHACMAAFVATFGKRAWRRPLDDGETQGLVALFDAATVEQGLDARNAVGLVLQAILQSPNFLYHWELASGSAPIDDDGDGIVALVDDHLASRLSYLLWGSMPDDALFEAAERGELSERDALEEHARRMLEDPRAIDTLEAFAIDWLRLEGWESAVKDFAPLGLHDEAGVRAAMAAELRAFLADTVLASGSLRELLAADHSFANAALGDVIYGVSGLGDDHERIELDPARRAGLLSLPIVMTAHAFATSTSPVARGRLVREQLLCETMPPPPAEIDNTPKPTPPGSTTRMQYDVLLQDPACAGCHLQMQPLGYAFEHLDAVGRFRDQESGQTIDASAELDGLALYGAAELGTALAADSRVQDCIARQWLRRALGRLEVDADADSLAEIQATFAASDFDLRELLVAIVVSPGFRHRALGEGEPSP